MGHRSFLTVVHHANEIIEREAGAKSEALAVYWGLVATESTSEFALQVAVVDAASPQTTFTFRDVTDLVWSNKSAHRQMLASCGLTTPC
jgi:hypothetical protein